MKKGIQDKTLRKYLEFLKDLYNWQWFTLGYMIKKHKIDHKFGQALYTAGTIKRKPMTKKSFWNIGKPTKEDVLRAYEISKGREYKPKFKKKEKDIIANGKENEAVKVSLNEVNMWRKPVFPEDEVFEELRESIDELWKTVELNAKANKNDYQLLYDWIDSIKTGARLNRDDIHNTKKIVRVIESEIYNSYIPILWGLFKIKVKQR